jgi:HAMP domain-containing protein
MNRLFRETCISIRTSVLICFILVIAAMILPAVQCAYHLGGHDGEGGKARLTGTDTAPGDAHGTGPDNRDRPDARITDIRNQLFMGVLAALACAIGVFLFLMKTVVVPVRRLADGTRILADGRLDVAVPPGPRNDIGRIGFAVNELAVNLQEVLLHA